MQIIHTAPKTNAKLFFIHQEASLNQDFKERNQKNNLLTIALNTGESQRVIINDMPHEFPGFSIIPLFANQAFEFEKPQQVTVWQYTRDFYCIIEGYHEISCIGLLFFGFNGPLFLKLDDHHREKLRILQQMFIEELNITDKIQTDMLQILLKSLIVITTRLAKEQYIHTKVHDDDKFDIIRQFNILVERHYKKEHQVQYYASLLNKSPKTLANIFAQYNYRSPSLIIQDQIIIEAKRLFYYSKKSAKEVAHDLGYTDAANFSRVFKNSTNQSPSDFRKNRLAMEI